MAYLSAEFLPGPHLANNLLNLGITEQTRQALAELGIESRRPGRAGGGARPGQRRPWAAGVVLPGFAGVAGSARHRLRHPLRVRHLRPDHQGRLAGGDHRQVAALRQPVGDRPARDRLRGEVRRAHRGLDRRAGPLPRALDSRHRGQGRGLRHARSSATAWAPATRCGCGRPRRSSRSTSPRSTTATTTGRSRTRCTRRTSPRSSTRTTRCIQGKTLRLQQQFFFVTCSLQDMIRVHLLLERPLDTLPREVGRPAQRHPSGHRRGRTDAPAGGRARDGLGHGLARHAQHLRLHQPHAAARGAGEVAGRSVRPAAAAAPGDHLRDQPPLPRRGARDVSRATTPAWRGCR